MAPRRPLYLHIGLHKTGTTSLQKLLADHEAAFARAGYQPADRMGRTEPGHHRLVSLIETEGPEGFARAVGATPGDAVLVSCERLCKEFRAQETCRAVLAALSRAFRVTVIVFLRRQDFLKESVYAEVVKIRHSPDIMAEVKYQYDIGPLMRALEASLGDGQLRVALYRDDLDGGGDLSAAFLHAIGWSEGTAVLPRLPRVNTSLHRRARLFLGQVDKPRPAFARALVRTVVDSGAIESDGIAELMSPAQRAGFLAPYLAENRAYAQALRLDGGAFYASPPDDGLPWSPPAPIRRAEYQAVRDLMAEDLPHTLVFDG